MEDYLFFFYFTKHLYFKESLVALQEITKLVKPIKITKQITEDTNYSIIYVDDKVVAYDVWTFNYLIDYEKGNYNNPIFTDEAIGVFEPYIQQLFNLLLESNKTKSPTKKQIDELLY